MPSPGPSARTNGSSCVSCAVENKELKLEREILRKAAAYFAFNGRPSCLEGWLTILLPGVCRGLSLIRSPPGAQDQAA